ncbi:uncharacterized protein BX663DRAFT_556092 [Cokeromyces recurvatus]|uniref:uncharacterized protein n=1 Tax=Cokeromyces recurvatus TaxID=90255 RepID=UPI00221EB513|nr:uncharacterized protein BX663DRAFT_556092 [Cokeromyces recurvatus]KAI7898140.1 hypothetical protein BX663DRAFT_556092 [Cokeromyces recurvatus]
MKNDMSAISRIREKGKLNDKKYLMKPLPSNNTLVIDSQSRIHILKLLDNWLSEFSLLLEPWSKVLYSIGIVLFEKFIHASSSSTNFLSLLDENNNNNNEIWLQILSINDPIESRFLTKVFHGVRLNNGHHSFRFPIGGTIRLYGLNDTKIKIQNVIEIVDALVYLIHSLYLETYVMRDSHVKLIISSYNVNWNSLESINISDETTKKYSSLKEKEHHDSTSSSTVMNCWKPFHMHLLSSSKSLFKKVGKTTKHELSLLNVRNNKSLQLSYSHHSSFANFDTIKQENSHDYFSKLKLHIENASFISSSPNCHFPCPILLNRLETEEKMLIKEQKRLLTLYKDQYNISSDKNKAFPLITEMVQLPQSITAYTSIRSSSHLLADSKKGLEHLMLDTTSLNSFRNHQSITFAFTCFPTDYHDKPCLGPLLSTIHYFKYHPSLSSSSTTTTKDNIIHTLFNLFPIRNFDQPLGNLIYYWCNQCRYHTKAQSQWDPGVVVETSSSSTIKMNKLNNNNNNPVQVENHETTKKTISSLSLFPPFPSSSSIIPSTADDLRSIKFYDCCKQSFIKHTLSFAHGIGRIQICFSTREPLESTEKTHEMMIMTWILCNQCDDAKTVPTILSKETGSFSFAKYLELIFYSATLASPEPFCKHTKRAENDRKSGGQGQHIVRCFQYKDICVQFTYHDNDMTYYEIRMPKIRLSLGIVEQKNEFSFSSPRMSITTLMEWRDKSAERDVDLFFETIRTHLNALQHYTMTECKRKYLEQQRQDLSQQQQMEAKLLEIEIMALSKRLDMNYKAMKRALQDTNLNELNDFRRYFAIQSESIIEYLADWQEEKKCFQVTTDTIYNWDHRPEYTQSKGIHCFPGSSVLVREDEPTSIIAYTLSSNDYFRDMLQYEENESHPDAPFKEPVITVITEDNDSHLLAALTNKKRESIATTTTSSSAIPTYILDKYYSSIEPSFRTTITEIVKSSVAERQEEDDSKPEKKDLLLKRKHITERTLKTLVSIQQQEEKREANITSHFYNKIPSNSIKRIMSPHLKHTFIHDGVEFTCIVYYAKEFEILRRQCDINQLMIESISRCQSWSTTGGKSKSRFYKSQDDRFVIKEMMNAWNIAEKDAFLKFAPNYFEHIKKSANEPSILAKIFGFFTIQTKNLLDKKTIFNLDVLVMEYLFFKQNIIKKFDFKGIHDRHLDKVHKQKNDTTLWDRDWLNEFRMYFPVYETSKAIMELAIRNDTEFLAKCNIMDYSLLVGIDQDKHEIVVGIIGAYTWYKKIESKSKSTLQPRKEVTIVPPDQYRLRFCREICNYFISIPGKFDFVTPSGTSLS